MWKRYSFSGLPIFANWVYSISCNRFCTLRFGSAANPLGGGVGVVVSIIAFQAIGRGSIPRRRKNHWRISFCSTRLFCSCFAASFATPHLFCLLQLHSFIGSRTPHQASSEMTTLFSRYFMSLLACQAAYGVSQVVVHAL